MKKTQSFVSFLALKHFVSGVLLATFLVSNVWAQVPSAPSAPAPGQPAGNQGRPSGQPAGNQGRPSGQPAGTAPSSTTPQATNGNQTTNTTDTPDVNADKIEKVKETGLKTTIKGDSVEQAQKAKLQALRNKIFGTQIFNNPNLTFTPSSNIATPRDYTIGPKDNLTVYIYGYSQNTIELAVTSEGFVSIPRVGLVQLSGRTIDQAQKELIQRLSPYYYNLGMPNAPGASTYLQIALAQIRTIRVTVLGEVITPGTYNISSLSTALDALYSTGGPNELGSFREIKVVRKNKPVATIDLYEQVLTGSLSTDVRLQDNDVIFVAPYKKRIELKGTFKRPGLYELLPTDTFRKALEFAGGFNEVAYTARLLIYGITARERRVTDLSSKEFDTYIPSNGDEILADEVLTRYENMVTITGPVFRPGFYSLESNKTLLQLIKSADGLKGEAFIGRINVVRTREDLSVETISLNLADMINGKTSDLQLMREDQIIIPSKFELREPAVITIRGEVNKGSLEMPFNTNMTVEDVVLQAGGFKEAAANTQIEVVRRRRDVNLQLSDAAISKVFLVNVNPDLTLDADDSRFVLEPYDEIIVRPASNYQSQTFITVKGEVLNPGEYGLKTKDEKISDLVKRSGGLTAQAYERGATLRRTVALSEEELAVRNKSILAIGDDAKKGKFEAETVTATTQDAIGIDLERIMKDPGGREDMILQDGDILDIPKRLETVRLQGQVLHPATVKYRVGDSFTDYISQAGGFTRGSLRRKSYVIYPNGSVDRTRKFLFFNIYPRVEPGSDVIVPNRTASDLLEAQQAAQSIIGLSQTVLLLFTSIIAITSFRR
ncbi:MAG: ligand-binding protein [Runella slithyformis]|nr:MAG: ligand-binding protein [Runella slithyformis]TAF28970.1 MAG: ligand-binding protein [Runella slithyformis]TAF46430.1 MAG: ligand-binding protein [Runella slithyformis]TAF82626.1 MAG: ligand-binding protein [Runella slithyformis]